MRAAVRYKTINNRLKCFWTWTCVLDGIVGMWMCVSVCKCELCNNSTSTLTRRREIDWFVNTAYATHIQDKSFVFHFNIRQLRLNWISHARIGRELMPPNPPRRSQHVRGMTSSQEHIILVSAGSDELRWEDEENGGCLCDVFSRGSSLSSSKSQNIFSEKQ